jgi:hypothetical protein
MSTQQTETASAGTSTPTSDGWILILQIKPGQKDELLATVGAELEKASDPDSAIGQGLLLMGDAMLDAGAVGCRWSLCPGLGKITQERTCP